MIFTIQERRIKSIFSKRFLLLPAFFSALLLQAEEVTVTSPNQKIHVTLESQPKDTGTWFLKVDYSNDGETCEILPQIDLGLSRSDQNFRNHLRLVKVGTPKSIHDNYTLVHGKKSECSNSATELVASFETPSDAKIDLTIRAYNDGVAFRYSFPESTGTFVVKDEFTAYTIPENTDRWLEKWNRANEGLYQKISNGEQQQSWCYPALFKVQGQNCWYLIHEADLNNSYCGTKLANTAHKSQYKLTFPDTEDGNGMGESQPTISLPWKSPWRVVIIGSLADIVESTLVTDVSAPSLIADTSWIKPGIASWNYWSNNHGTKDYQVVCKFADLAAEMNWPYTLLDWEWDTMQNGGNLKDAVKYIHSKGIKPLIWYNSGGKHTWVPATPKDRMLTHENRVEEFTRLSKMGFAGVKIDFFESEKQNMIQYYLDILEDAANFRMLVYFHGCLVPRGWSRTYPNLMTHEGVRGAEWYNNGPELTTTAPEHNTVLPFTRNVIGPMDYTPVTFTNSQYPHITSYGHELALSIVFESGIQHFADRPEGYQTLPEAAKSLLKEMPNAWDDTVFLSGYPGKEIILARRKGSDWYVGGINGGSQEQYETISFDFLPEGISYRLVLITDGEHNKELKITYQVVDKTSSTTIKLLCRGGFAASLSPLDN
ncbi:MAG: glycoside hydrolase family 97 catalytic domain-containing protein [Opitutales bacterium]|nr:glycoside hydrolase family 97 catalytic domain-containing protein [Opitutales bacterium]